MAANDYYNTSYNNSYSNGPRRHDGPLPPIPSSSPAPHVRPPANSNSAVNISPVTSPFADQAYPDYPAATRPQHQPPPSLDTAYHGASGGRQNDPYAAGGHDPFADQNAIPLQSQSQLKVGGSPTRYNSNPEGGFPPYGGYKESKKKGWFTGRVTWVVYILTTVQIAVFIGELIKMGILTGTPIQIHPNVNPMIGPSPFVTINMGARFVPCMHNVVNITNASEPVTWPCPNSTTTTGPCSLSQLCGFGGLPHQDPGTAMTDRSHEPNQWWRFIVPMFLHAGIIHIAFNMMLQVTLGRDMEKEIGSLRFALVYFSSGIFGFVLGGNYAAPGQSSTGASGALFGILALTLLDLLYNWSTRRSPVKDLLFLLLDICISFVLGLLPGLDNFSHIGGFLMGLALGICLIHSPAFLRERIGVDQPAYSGVDTQPLTDGSNGTGVNKFVKQPVGFFKGRKPLWWVWWLFRAGCLVAVLIGFILLLKNFYEWRNTCSWCYRLSCLPVSNWCEIGQFKNT